MQIGLFCSTLHIYIYIYVHSYMYTQFTWSSKQIYNYWTHNQVSEFVLQLACSVSQLQWGGWVGFQIRATQPMGSFLILLLPALRTWFQIHFSDAQFISNCHFEKRQFEECFREASMNSSILCNPEAAVLHTVPGSLRETILLQCTIQFGNMGE